MGVTRHGSYEITSYSDGCLWGSARVEVDGGTYAGEWKYPSDLSDEEVLLCLTLWATAIWAGERDEEVLDTLATAVQLSLPFCPHRSRRL